MLNNTLAYIWYALQNDYEHLFGLTSGMTDAEKSFTAIFLGYFPWILTGLFILVFIVIVYYRKYCQGDGL